MRFDLVVNTFVKDALLTDSLKLHGGGWMWRPLVGIGDCADATIAAYEAPAAQVQGEIFNVVHSNYQIRELAMIVAGSVQLSGRVALEDIRASGVVAIAAVVGRADDDLVALDRHRVAEALPAAAAVVRIKLRRFLPRPLRIPDSGLRIPDP